MIPAGDVSPRALKALMEYLRTEIYQAQAQRRPLEDKWISYKLAYKAQPKNEIKEFPFYGAANLVLPIVATDVDTIFSRLMGLLFASEDLWTARPLNPAFLDYAPRLQEFLRWAQEHELGIYDAIGDWLMEMCKLGTGVLKQRYTRESRKVYQFRETDFGIIEQQMEMLIKDHPVVQHVPLEDFFIPATAQTIQDAPWVAERLMLTWGQLANRAAAGIYQGVEHLQSWRASDKGGKLRQLGQSMDGYVPGYGDQFELYEAWLDYDITDSGEPSAIVCTVHLPTMLPLRIDWNPFLNQEKPFSAARYLRQEGRFYGIGLAEMLEQFQEEVTTMHNQRLDNATLANSSMFKARKGIGIRQDEPIIPGRWFLLDDMDDVQAMPMGQIYDSTVSYEQLTLNYATRRTGVNDYITGQDSPSIGYGTATTAVQQLREGAKRFDQVLRETRRCLGEVGTRVVELYQQFNQSGKEYMVLGQDDGQLVHEVLQFPLELLRYGVGIELTATSAAYNKEVEIRTNTLIMQMLMQFYQQLMQAAQLMGNPQVPPMMQQLAQSMMQGGVTLMRRILDSYGVQDIDRILPDLTGAVNNAAQQLATIQGALAGGAVPAPGMLQQPGVPALPAGPQGTSFGPSL